MGAYKILKSISTEASKELPDSSPELDKQLDKFINIFQTQLTKEEKRAIIRIIVETIHYKAALEDPKRVANVYASRTKMISVTILWLTGSITLIIGLLGLSPTITKTFEAFMKLADLF